MIWDEYERLCHPDKMGATYKVMFFGDKSVGEVYPFLSPEEIERQLGQFS
jgi:hypothetical protein